MKQIPWHKIKREFTKSDKHFLCKGSETFERIYKLEATRALIVKAATAWHKTTKNKDLQLIGDANLLFSAGELKANRTIRLQFLEHQTKKQP